MFCGSTNSKITAEHLWPTWLSDAWNLGKYSAVLKRLGEGIGNPIDREWKTDEFDVRTSAVCNPCNSRTLNLLEGRVKDFVLPLSLGRTTHLTRERQMDLSAWITRIAMLTDFSHPNVEGTNFSPTERKSFIDTLMPISDTWVWIGVFQASTREVAVMANRPVPDNSETFEVSISVTGVIGSLAFQFLSRRWNKRPSDAEIDCSMYPIQRDWHPAVHQIWPIIANDVHWPTTTFDLTINNINAFTDRWGGRSYPYN